MKQIRNQRAQIFGDILSHAGEKLPGQGRDGCGVGEGGVMTGANPKQLRDTIITLRTTRSVKAVLVALARVDRRSLTNLIEQLILAERDARRQTRKRNLK
jgi:hypothetical protein